MLQMKEGKNFKKNTLRNSGETMKKAKETTWTQLKAQKALAN